MNYHIFSTAKEPYILSMVAAVILCASATSNAAIDKITSSTPIALLSPTIPVSAQALLDVGIVAFDDGLNLTDEDDTVFPEVRLAESVYFATQLLRVLEKSGAWGPVRVIPDKDAIMDLYIEGTILQSDGETLAMDIVARDSSGLKWFTKTYRTTVGKYAYDRRRKSAGDPFQNLYISVANELLRQYEGYGERRALELRRLSEMRFAQRFSSEAFSQYTQTDKEGKLKIVRLPADADPLLERVRRIRDRDHLYIDRMQEFYDGFSRQMHGPYQDFRRASYDSVVKARQLQKQGNQRIIAGIGTIVAGIYGRLESDSSAGRLASTTTAGAGGLLVKSGLEKKQRAASYNESVAEMGVGLETALAPEIIELEDRTVTLSGNVQAKYQQWQALLLQIYAEERRTPENE
ncbi:MAG: hypothetical protein CBC09_06310 [Cellvibrionales bacterium TMED49]|nr:hypothetical protein [Porticoccaceae bacterium]OUU37873.1 MAG: hypothetical protein CBC09_06310 [Cellvibrionales bacterium TMED49]